MSISKSKRAAREALLSSAASVGIDTDTTPPTPVDTVPATPDTGVTTPDTDLPDATDVVNLTVASMRGEATAILERVTDLEAQTDNVAQRLVPIVSRAYGIYCNTNVADSRVCAIHEMIDHKHAWSAGGKAFYKALILDLVGSPPTAPNPETVMQDATVLDMSARYKAHAARVRRAAQAFVAIATHSKPDPVTAQWNVWSDEHDCALAPSVAFLPVVVTGDDYAFMVPNPANPIPDMVPLNGRKWFAWRVKPTDGDKNDTASGNFSFAQLISRFFATPKHLAAAPRAAGPVTVPVDGETPAGTDESGTAKGRDEVQDYSGDYFKMLRGGFDIMANPDAITAQHFNENPGSIDWLRAYKLLYDRVTLELQQAAIAANVANPPRSEPTPIVDHATATPVAAEPIIDVVVTAKAKRTPRAKPVQQPMQEAA